MAVHITVWAVYTDGDDRNIGTPTEWYSTEAKAKLAASGRGWYGGDASVREHPAIVADGATYVLRSYHPVDIDGELAKRRSMLKDQAMKKLSPEEQQALGVK